MKKILVVLLALLLPGRLFAQGVDPRLGTGMAAPEPVPDITEVRQTQALPALYFKTVVRRSPGGEARVTGVNVYDKKTDKRLQQLKADGTSHGADGVQIGDYNFDGQPEFSIFETGYAGPNTSQKYFLLDPKTGRFFESGFKGVSLSFDAKTKTITERNQCCAGSQVTTADYKVVNNKMVLLKRHCFRWNDKKNKLVEQKWAACE